MITRVRTKTRVLTRIKVIIAAIIIIVEALKNAITIDRTGTVTKVIII